MTMTDTEIDETDRDRSPDELLDWLCWENAMTAERFYPPDETAAQCIGDVESDENPVSDREIGSEEGYHRASWLSAVAFFEDLERLGYDPRARTEREIENAADRGLDISTPDWTWYDETIANRREDEAEDEDHD